MRLGFNEFIIGKDAHLITPYWAPRRVRRVFRDWEPAWVTYQTLLDFKPDFRSADYLNLVNSLLARQSVPVNPPADLRRVALENTLMEIR